MAYFAIDFINYLEVNDPDYHKLFALRQAYLELEHIGEGDTYAQRVAAALPGASFAADEL